MLSGISDRHNEFKRDKMIFPNLSVMYGERVCTVRYEMDCWPICTTPRASGPNIRCWRGTVKLQTENERDKRETIDMAHRLGPEV